MLYSIAIGYGRDPCDEDDLSFAYEKQLRVPPMFANVLGYPGFWSKDPATGIDATKLLHGEQSLSMHKPLKAAGTVVGLSRVLRLADRGTEKGAVMLIERSIVDADTGDLLATVQQLNILRGDGGFSAGGQPSDPLPDSPPPIPDTPATHCSDLPTRAEAALIYRLTGDDNALHADPTTARAAGYERPILHGLATFGIAGRAILKTFCGSRPDGMATLRARFTSPVFPGETLRTEMWRAGATVRFRVLALERCTVVLDRGLSSLR